MSYEAMEYVLAHSNTTGTDRVIMLILAKHANEDGEAWPTRGRIAAFAGVSTRSVTTALGKLEEGGELKRVVNGGAGAHGGWQSNRFKLVMPVCGCPRGAGGRIAHAPAVLGVEGQDET